MTLDMAACVKEVENRWSCCHLFLCCRICSMLLDFRKLRHDTREYNQAFELISFEVHFLLFFNFACEFLPLIWMVYTRSRTKQKFGQWYLSGAASVVCVQIAFIYQKKREVRMANVHWCGWRIQSLYVLAGKTWMLSGFRGDLSKLLFPNRPLQLFLLRLQLVMGFRWGCTDAQPSFKVGLCPGSGDTLAFWNT